MAHLFGCKSLRIKFYLITFLVSFLTASIGANFTVLDDWYYSLIQPSWKPDDLIFPITWTIIFTFAQYQCVVKVSTQIEVKLNVFIKCFPKCMVEYLYFSLKGLIWFCFSLGSIIILILFSKAINNVASFLLIPYLAWVTLASVQLETTRLNGFL